ncbi:MAG: fructosamine kinase family protein, partial [Miltoncostaeaceae bacterium]
ICRAHRVELDDGATIFVKHLPDAPASLFEREAAGLRWLAGAGALRVPEVLGSGAGHLALEWIDSGRPAPDHDERLGRGLAALHRAGADAFGAGADGWIGTLPLPNSPLPTWDAFLAQRRIEPLIRAGVDRGILDPGDATLWERVRGRLEELLGAAAHEPPARLHGDLWSGNAMTDAAGRPVLIDPAAHGGHREVDLAMMRLFGGFSGRVFAAYDEEHPPAPGEPGRRALHQLHPLLVHAVLFGGGYPRRVRAILRDHA